MTALVLSAAVLAVVALVFAGLGIATWRYVRRGGVSESLLSVTESLPPGVASYTVRVSVIVGLVAVRLSKMHLGRRNEG